MGEGKTNMFGKTYNTIGSTDSNFIIKTKGDLKVQWGGKFIDIIKNGKIASSSTNILKTASSSDDISDNGIYLIPTEEGNEVWISIDGTKIPLNSSGEQYISFLEKQMLTSEQKDQALINIGFNYNTLEDAKNANITTGLVFIKDLGQLFLIKDGTISEFKIQSNNDSTDKFTKLTVGEIELFESIIRAVNSLDLQVGNTSYLALQDGKIQVNGDLVMNSTSLYSYGATSNTGYRLYNQNNKSVLEVDKIIVREDASLPSNYINISVEDFRSLVQSAKMDANVQYRLYNFRNFWELAEPEILPEDATESNPSNVHPLIVTAKNNYEYYQDKCILEEDTDYIISYDISYDKTYTIDGTNVQALGLITKMTDKYGNSCNYNFKHLKFLRDGIWNYTFGGSDNTNSNVFYNNTINLSNIRVEINHNGTVLTLEDLPNYAILETPCYGNSFYDQRHPLFINSTFNNNTMFGSFDQVVCSGVIQECTFKEDVSNTTFNSMLDNCTFNYVVNNASLFQDSSLTFKNCQFQSTMTGEIQTPDEIIRSLLASDETTQVNVYSEAGVRKLRVMSNSSLLIPSGVILMWSGTEIPYGWAICDGTNGTPNLVGKFIKAVASADEVGDNDSILDENNELILSQDYLPKHSHPHKAHTHSLSGDLSGTTGSSGDLSVSLEYSDYNWGIESVSKTFVTSVTGEGITTETGTVDGVSNIKTQGGTATGGSHTHSISWETDEGTSLSSATSEEQTLSDSEWPNKPLKIEPRSYSLVFIMKL